MMGKALDLTGKKFGRLTVIERVENDKEGHTRWLCRCDCGSQRIVLGKCLKNGHTQSCGCLNKEVVSNMAFKDHTGERFGRLTVISRADDYIAPNGSKHVCWLCLCDCGNKTVVDVTQLVGGHTKSCGCLRDETKSNLRHGGRYDRLYGVLHNMIDRCYNSKGSTFKYYGGRGIKICDEWRHDYAKFKQWAMESGYDPNAPFGECTIDRIDVNGDYEPSNCRWVSMAVQSKNKRNVINK